MLDHDHARVLVLGPAMWRAGTGWSGQQPLLAAELPDNDAATTTTVLTWCELGNLQLHQIPAPETGPATVECPPPLVTATLRPNPAWTVTAEALWPEHRPIPLMLLTRHQDEISAHWLVRLTAEHAVFLRLSPVKDGSIEATDGQAPPRTGREALPALLTAAFSHAEQHRTGIYNHECARHDPRPGLELEHKLTLLAPVDLHTVISDLREQIAAHPAWVWNLRGDWQWWDFENHLYGIPDGRRRARAATAGRLRELRMDVFQKLAPVDQRLARWQLIHWRHHRRL